MRELIVSIVIHIYDTYTNKYVYTYTYLFVYIYTNK